MDRAIVAGAEVAGAVVRHDNRTRRRHDDRTRGRRDDNRRGLCDDNWLRDNWLCDDNWLRDNRRGLCDNDWRGLCHDDRSLFRDDHRLCDDWRRLGDDRRLGDNGRLCDNRRLRIDDDCGWRFDGFRDVGDGVHDVKHRVEAAVVESSVVVVMVRLSLEGVARQKEGCDNQTDNGVACVFHVYLLF